MSAPIIITKNWYPEAYDMVIDVRAPVEFAQDHIVGAVNMPVLSDAETYRNWHALQTKLSLCSAQARGSAGIAKYRPSYRHEITGFACRFQPPYSLLAGRPAFACLCPYIKRDRLALSLAGRRLQGLSPRYSGRAKGRFFRPVLVIIAGRTGSAKTDILAEIKNQGGQIIDLEALATSSRLIIGTLAR